jgi:cyclophilin family peptidyl-prolyl cis-trans isomerase
MLFRLVPFAAQGARRAFASLAAIAVAIILTGCQTMPLSAQDDKPGKDDDEAEVEKPKADPDSPAGKFQAAIGELEAKQKTLQKMQREFQTANEERQQELAKEYEKTVIGLQKSLPEIRKLAMAAYADDPKAEPKALEFLTAMVARELSGDEYEAALKSATTLLDKGAKDAVLLSLAGQAAYCMDQFDVAEKYLTAARKAGRLDRAGMQYVEDLEEAKDAWAKEEEVRKAEAAKDDNPRVKLETDKGDIIIELYEDQAPGAVGNFISLVKKGFYDGLTFHRVLPGFMAQGGCPEGTGTGGPGYKIFCECEKPDHRNHFRGTLSMAHAGKDTGGSQFFLTFRRTSHLDGKHTVFGRVVEGLDLLEKIQRIDPQQPTGIEPDTIKKATVIRDRGHEYKPKIASKGN